MALLKNIIFDFGNVLLTIDEPKALKALAALLKGELEPEAVKKMLYPWFLQFETGSISVDILLNKVLDFSKKTTTPRMIIDAWNSMLIGIPLQRFEMLEKLTENYDIYLLSNTNIITVMAH